MGVVLGGLVYPHPAFAKSLYIAGGIDGGIHETGGLSGNWALDFMAPGGTPLVAPQAATVMRISGHDPSLGEFPGAVFGWNLYLKTVGGVTYFITHIGRVDVHVGQKVKKGEQLGLVGSWPHDPGRSHSHIGVTHPMGKRAAIARIKDVARAKKIA